MRSCHTFSNNNQIIFAIDHSLPFLEHPRKVLIFNIVLIGPN
jgi:hypothetical protein